MRRTLLAALCTLMACSADPGTADGGNDADGGTRPDAGTPSRWAFHAITDPDDLVDFDMAVAPDGRVGVVYYHRIDTHTHGQELDYELRYQEWNGSEVSAAETIRVSQRLHGLDILFGENGQPVIAYLGGETPESVSVFWHQSDAALARRSASGTWTEEVVAEEGNEALAGNPVSDRGPLVGIFPAIAGDASSFYFAWRDCHDGQYPLQDWHASDLELAEQGGAGWQKRVVIAGGDDKQGWGGHLQMVMANGQPAIISDQVLGGASGDGANVIFNRRNADGTWTTPIRPINAIGNTQSGPSMDWDPELGFAIAVVDRAEDRLVFTRSADEGKTWTEPRPIWEFGTGGWYPSLAINPLTHEPSIAFYVCSNAGGVDEGNCLESDDRLMVAERISNVWRDETVDEAGAWRPKIDHLADGRRVIAYRDPRSGAIKLAVEK